MIVSGDWETFYDSTYSLSKMSEVEYILDDRFEPIMLALKIGHQPSKVYVGEAAIAAALAKLDWSQVAWLSHNTRFDGSILAWRFGYVPRLYLDTLSMARAITHWELGRSSLKAVSEHLGLPPKGNEVLQAKGKRLADFDPDELRNYKDYCIRDNDNCYEIFKELRGYFTAPELQLIDLVLRMFIVPQVQLDSREIEAHLAQVRIEKAQALARVRGIDKKVFASNQQFADLLRSHGVAVPMKRSPTTGNDIPALARGDWAFKELCLDDTQPPIVQAILATRQSVKSTIDETRAEALLRLADTDWPTQGRGWAAIPLKYSGARTHRLSGDGGTNFQNIRRGSKLRQAIAAPDGFRIVHRDASQIEARMVAWLSWCWPLLEAFNAGRDVYSEFASIIYGRTITKSDTLERFIGKTAILGLGYGCGAPKFRHMLFIGNGGLSAQIELADAETIVSAYRTTYVEITDLWDACGIMLRYMIHGTPLTSGSAFTVLQHLPIHPTREEIWLPSGMRIHYPKLGYEYRDDGRKDICYNGPNGGSRKIYGAKVVENISQALARIVVTDAALRTYQISGYTPWLSTHDSLDFCVPAEVAEDMNRELERQFAIRPAWAPDLPLASEGGWGKTLADAERGANE